MSIAQRRHHTRRLKRNRKNYWHWNEKTPGELGVLVNTPHPCSCRSCGNQRKWEGETKQEKIDRQSAKDAITDATEPLPTQYEPESMVDYLDLDC